MWIAACLVIALQIQDPPLQQAWTVDFEDFILGTPVGHGDLVFAASKNGKVRAFKAETGEPAWWFDSKVPVLSNLVVFKERLFVPGLTRSTLLDPKTGKELREDLPGASRVVAGASRLYLLESLMWANDVMHIGSSRTVTALDPATGKSTWRREFPHPGASTVVELGGRLYLPGDRLLLALEAGTGKQVGEAHKFEVKGACHGAADKDRLFLAPQGPKGVVCFNRTTLKELWSCPVDGYFSAIPPILQPDRLIVFPLPYIVAIDLKTGKELWTAQVEGKPDYSSTPPAMRGSEICVGSKGVLCAIDSAAGKATWTLRTVMPDGVSFVPQPAWAGDRLLHAVGHRLTCFKLK